MSSILVNSESGIPVSNATVHHVNRKGDVLQSILTDSTGLIIFDSGFTGMMFGGSKFRYKIVKEGYITIEAAEKWPPPKILLENDRR